MDRIHLARSKHDLLAETHLTAPGIGQKCARNSTQALRGAPGAKKVALCAGLLPAYGPSEYAGNGIVCTAPCAVKAVLAN